MKRIFESRKTVLLYNADMVTGAIVIVVALFLILFAVPHHISLGFGTAKGITPRTFPYGVSVVILICGFKILWDGYSEHVLAKKLTANGVSPNESITFFGISFLITLLGVAFTALLYPLGYPLTNALVVLCMYYISGGKKLWAGVVTGVGFSVISFLFFAVYLKLSIPMGFGL